MVFVVKQVMIFWEKKGHKVTEIFAKRFVEEGLLASSLEWACIYILKAWICP